MLTLPVRDRIKSKRTPTPKIDELLESIGLVRHVVPKDGNSLFRCISQCVFLTQSCHMNVRQHLLQFSTLQTKEFNQISQLCVNEYAKKITDIKLDGDLLDMRIAAKLYNIKIHFFVDAHPFIPLTVETPNAVKTLNICLNYQGTYDLVLIKESVANISLCQAIIYEMLYNQVFRLSGVDFAVKEMLFERNFPSLKLNDRISLEKRATCTDMKELLEIGITPVPFKVAKALSPIFFRNTEYDIWLNSRRERFYGKWNNWEFKEGSKCMVTIGNQDYLCYIQNIRGKNEPVEVYVKELVQKICVGFNQLKIIPVEDDVREMTTADDENTSICEVLEQCETPVQYRNSDFIHRSTIHEVLPSYLLPPYYVHQYQQQPSLSMSPLNLTINGNVMHPLYMPVPPSLMPNDFHPFKENIVLLEPSPNFNNNCSPPNFPKPNFIDNFSKISGQHVQPVLSPCYCDHQPSTSCSCIQLNNGKESGVAVDSNFMDQP